LNAQTDTALLNLIYNDLFSLTLWYKFPFYYLFIVSCDIMWERCYLFIRN